MSRHVRAGPSIDSLSLSLSPLSLSLFPSLHPSPPLPLHKTRLSARAAFCACFARRARSELADDGRPDCRDAAAAALLSPASRRGARRPPPECRAVCRTALTGPRHAPAGLGIATSTAAERADTPGSSGSVSADSVARIYSEKSAFGRAVGGKRKRREAWKMAVYLTAD